MAVGSGLQSPLDFNPQVLSVACSTDRHHCMPVFFRGSPHKERGMCLLSLAPLKDTCSHHSWHKLKLVPKSCAELGTSVSQPDLLCFADG